MLNTSKIRYKSNSQQLRKTLVDLDGCAQYFKDTIQEQFTTALHRAREGPRLCSILQRYDTRAIHNLEFQYFCDFQLCSILQRYDTRAIHNYGVFRVLTNIAVLNTSKIRYKSNSQLKVPFLSITYRCAQYFKDTIQEQFTTSKVPASIVNPLCSILQRYDTRAIHNFRWCNKNKASAVLNTSKIRYKSNSQLLEAYSE